MPDPFPPPSSPLGSESSKHDAILGMVHQFDRAKLQRDEDKLASSRLAMIEKAGVPLEIDLPPAPLGKIIPRLEPGDSLFIGKALENTTVEPIDIAALSRAQNRPIQQLFERAKSFEPCGLHINVGENEVDTLARLQVNENDWVLISSKLDGKSPFVSQFSFAHLMAAIAVSQIVRRSAAGRADLVRLLGMLPREQHAHAASTLGFIPPKQPAPEMEIAVVDNNVVDVRNGAEGRTSGQEELAAQPSDLRIPLLRFEHMEFSNEPQEVKPRSPVHETMTSDDLRSPGRSLFATPRPQPLTPWSRLWPMLRDALQSSLPSHELDVAMYMRKVSRGETVHEIPRKVRRVWAGRFSVWIDRSSRLGPFWSDQMDVWQRLQKLCAKSGITRRLLDGRTQMRSIRQRRDLLERYSNTTEPILVLGELGLYGSDLDRSAWERTGKRLQRCGSRFAALVPAPSARLLPFMTRTWNAQAWERGRMRGKPEEGWTERRDRLLKMVSPVALLQPGLLRAIRRILPPALADASTEADVWNHEDVQVADATGWLLEPAALLKWREAFAADRSLDPYREKLSETIRVWHENLPREILRGETLVWHALVSDVSPPGDLQDAVAFAKRLEATALARGADTNVAEALVSFQKKLLATIRHTHRPACRCDNVGFRIARGPAPSQGSEVPHKRTGSRIIDP